MSDAFSPANELSPAPRARAEQARMQGIGLCLRLLITICVDWSQDERIDKDQPWVSPGHAGKRLNAETLSLVSVKTGIVPQAVPHVCVHFQQLTVLLSHPCRQTGGHIIVGSLV